MVSPLLSKVSSSSWILFTDFTTLASYSRSFDNFMILQERSWLTNAPNLTNSSKIAFQQKMLFNKSAKSDGTANIICLFKPGEDVVSKLAVFQECAKIE